ncbi:toxin biosynthesis cytochrome P450 monooxygenase [Diplocarpon rosae]|nr:toxin biosynthesis cytochrome P450 monooxygenase [Diplocarpon rosae]
MAAFAVARAIILSYAHFIAGCVAVYALGTAIYRLCLHPLSAYPGPWLWSVTRLPHAYHFSRGRLPYEIAELHRIYGPVVRIAPDELNYILEEAWQDIYAKPLPRNTQLRKDPHQFIENPDGPRGLLVEPRDEVHARHRRNLAPGFSEKILREQEPLLTQYFDLLIQKLHDQAGSPVDVAKYYEFTAVDIIGELTFGEPFSCLETSEMHLCLRLLHVAGRAIATLGVMQKFYPIDKIFLALFARIARREEVKYRTLTREKLLRRLALPDTRPDFIGYAQEGLNTNDGMMFDELCETSGILIAAGSETTASLLTAATYHLLTNPAILARLTDEVRTAFESEADITMVSVNGLEYLLAVLNEALRIYPPVPGNLVRITPPEGCTIAGRYVPGETCVAINHWSASHSPANFQRPNDFVPERWMGEPEFRKDKRRVVNPFSVGPRNCLGRNLAHVEMRVILARMVYHFDMELCEKSKGWLGSQIMYLLFDTWRPLMVKLTPVVDQ